MALRLPKSCPSDDRHAAWVRVVERMYGEQVNQGWHDQLFRLVRAVFSTNQSLSAEGGFLFTWIAENYIDASLMLVRRELDVQAGTENLRNLLEDISEHSEVLTRARYIAQWLRKLGETRLANREYDSFNPVRASESRDADYIDPELVKADLDQAVADAERLRIFAERTRAHRTPKQGVDVTLTLNDLHHTLVDLRRIIGKYYALLTLKSVADWELVVQFDMIAPFIKTWVTDAGAVARAADKEATG